MNILIKLSGIENKEELITRIKKEALDSSSSFEFYLDCPSSEFTKFEGFDKIHRFQNDGVALSAVIQKKEETDDPILYPLNSLMISLPIFLSSIRRKIPLPKRGLAPFTLLSKKIASLYLFSLTAYLVKGIRLRKTGIKNPSLSYSRKKTPSPS